jgi:hypothetical protein
MYQKLMMAPHRDHGPLTPIVSHQKRTSHLDWITAHGDRMGQFFASCAAGHTTASVGLKRRLACGPRQHFDRAVRELGRLYKTRFLLASLTVPALRRRVRHGLLEGEQRHACARQVPYGKQGQADGRDWPQHMRRARCLVLMLAAIIDWQIPAMDGVLRHWEPTEDGIDPALLTHISPIGWDNVVLYGAALVGMLLRVLLFLGITVALGPCPLTPDRARGVRMREDEATLAELLHPLSSLFAPLFFVVMGLQVDLSTLASLRALGFGLVLILCAFAGKLACAMGVRGSHILSCQITILTCNKLTMPSCLGAEHRKPSQLALQLV